MGASFYRNAESCVLVFDLTIEESFKNVETWRNEFLFILNPPDADKYPFILICLILYKLFNFTENISII